MQPGRSLSGFMPLWIGEFYAWLQFWSGMSSREVIQKIPLKEAIRIYPGLHDLAPEDAAKKAIQHMKKNHLFSQSGRRKWISQQLVSFRIFRKRSFLFIRGAIYDV